jgi:phosphate/sulfate permease
MNQSTRQIGFVALIAAVGGFALAALFWSLVSNDARDQRQQQQPQPQATVVSQNANDNRAGAQVSEDAKAKEKGEEKIKGEEKNKGGSSIGDVIGIGQGAAFEPHESLAVTVPRILLRLLLATALASMLAFRPRKNAPLVQRNLYVAQTQILLAVVASALMMIVGDNAARAFGIFAAASLVRFRTNIRDPKETTVLLINLALGLATGVGRIDVALVLAFFVLSLLWLLERRQGEQVLRAMELTVKTRNTERTQDVLQQIFRRHRIDGEVRQIDPPDEEEPVGCIMYFVNMSLNTSTDAVNAEIMAADPENVDGIEWEQQKSRDYIYQ